MAPGKVSNLAAIGVDYHTSVRFLWFEEKMSSLVRGPEMGDSLGMHLHLSSNIQVGSIIALKCMFGF